MPEGSEKRISYGEQAAGNRGGLSIRIMIRRGKATSQEKIGIRSHFGHFLYFCRGFLLSFSSVLPAPGSCGQLSGRAQQGQPGSLDRIASAPLPASGRGRHHTAKRGIREGPALFCASRRALRDSLVLPSMSGFPAPRARAHRSGGGPPRRAGRSDAHDRSPSGAGWWHAGHNRTCVR